MHLRCTCLFTVHWNLQLQFCVHCMSIDTQVEASCKVTAHVQKPDFLFRWNGQVHLNRRGRQFSRLLAAEVCASAFIVGRLLLKCDGTRAETRFCLSAKRTSPFKSAGALVQSTTGSRGVRISGSNAGYTMIQRWCEGYWLPTPFGSFPFTSPPVRHLVPSRFNWTLVMLDTPCSEIVWRVLATHSIRQFPLHFPSRASPCAITFQLESNNHRVLAVMTLNVARILPHVAVLPRVGSLH